MPLVGADRQTDKQTYIRRLMHEPPICPLWTEGPHCDPLVTYKRASCAPFFKGWSQKYLGNLTWKCAQWCITPKVVHNAAIGAQMPNGRIKWCTNVPGEVQTDGQNNIHMSPACIRTGGLKKSVLPHIHAGSHPGIHVEHIPELSHMFQAPGWSHTIELHFCGSGATTFLPRPEGSVCACNRYTQVLASLV